MSHLLKKRRRAEEELINFEGKVINFDIITDEDQDESISSDNGEVKKSHCKELIKKIVKGELTIKPFQVLRIERAKEAVQKRKDYYRPQLSRSVKDTKIPWPQGAGNNLDNSYNVSFYDPSKVEKRFCPPITTPQSCYGNKTYMKFNELLKQYSSEGNEYV